MRILYHHRTLGDGAEGIHIAEMVGAFRDLGHDVSLIGLAASAGESRTRALGAVKNFIRGGVAELAAAAACNAAEYLEVRRAIERYKPDLLYKRHARNDVAALAAARAAHVSSVLEVNCLYSNPDYRRFEPLAFETLTRRMERRALATATRILAVSSTLASQIRQGGFDNVTVLPNGANPITFDPGRRNGIQVRARMGLEKAVIVGWTGILRDWHGIELLIAAVAEVPGLHLLIVGDGPARAQVEARVAGAGLKERVILTGRIPHHSVPDYIGAMDIAVVAEDGTRVASPMKLLEYMSMGRAVVAPALDNIRDIVAGGVDGLLFVPGSQPSLVAALRRLEQAPSLRQLLGTRARQKVVERLNWRANATAVVQLLEEQDKRCLSVPGGTSWK